MSTAGEIDPGRPIGELVAERPARARLFERLHIDYCCGGQQTLAEACANAGAQLQSVRAALESLDEAGAQLRDGELTDWRAAQTAQLCEHIVSVHHDFLRQAFPRIGGSIATVVRVHGEKDLTLSDVERSFRRIRSALEPHLASEEMELFPLIVAVEQGGPPVSEEILAGHEQEHTEVGAALAELRSLCHDYDRRRAHCNTHLALLDALEELEHDLHQHVHEENNILFPRARGAHAPVSAQGGSAPHSTRDGHRRMDDAVPSLPVCCQGWIAEEGHRWAAHRR